MLAARHLTKRYGDTTAVDDLTFEVHPGRVTGFLGPNGAGKSTTFRLLLGLDRPSSGEALVGGRRYAEIARPAQEVGALLDASAAHPGRSARAHLLALARGSGIASPRVARVLETVGLSEVAGKRVGGFSLGMRQRLGIAAALLGDPATLVFDEPGNGLDLDGVLWVRRLVRELADEGRTVFFSSHLMSEMQLVADHLVVVGRGRLVIDAPMADVIDAWSRTRVTVRTPDTALLAGPLHRSRTAAGEPVEVQAGAGGELLVRGLEPEQVGELAHAAGARVHTLYREQGSLERAYLELTENAPQYRAEGADHRDSGGAGGADRAAHAGAHDPAATAVRQPDRQEHR
ncbi:ATP-binding cassette domain-containing protein [Streptomonospora litoralis]|uniref:Putative ABC transporter ATP-binding protein YxlF n=1 Tax=Streptomonospora litoralis TaxID=2498135 RepID=A0A4P6Q8F0_9ACTN|nr:ATP-binding cassette domain-containing protein [Streptomonospora litoralis]QBI55217.1 putative ABC transporter ATP-binding protein YxlF [Streptomonospora litoralis]